MDPKPMMSFSGLLEELRGCLRRPQIYGGPHSTGDIGWMERGDSGGLGPGAGCVPAAEQTWGSCSFWRDLHGPGEEAGPCSPTAWDPKARRGGCQGDREGPWEGAAERSRGTCPEPQRPPCPSVCPSAGVPMLSVQPKGKQKGCAGCNRKIKDRYLLKALDQYWHEDCLKCACCDCRLGEVGSTLYTKANLILCRRDYLRWAASPRPPPPARTLALPPREPPSPRLAVLCPASAPTPSVHTCPPLTLGAQHLSKVGMSLNIGHPRGASQGHQYGSASAFARHF